MGTAFYRARRRGSVRTTNAMGRLFRFEQLENRHLLSGVALDDFGPVSPDLNALAAAAEQQIVAGPTTATVQPGAPLVLGFQYSTSNGNESLTGLGLRIHYNSSVLAFVAFENVFATGLIQQQAPANDSANYDGDASTDKYVLLAWADISGAWPGVILPLTLAQARFTASPTASAGTVTNVRLTASSTAASYQFLGTPTAVTIVNPSATIGLFDPVASVFHLRNSNSTGLADYSFGYGDPAQGWKELVGNWDGAGGDTIGFFDPATATWYLRNSLSAGYADWTFGYGDPSLSHGHGDANWIPLVGDWDGNGTDTIGFFDPATCTWYLRNSLTVGYADSTFGYGDPSLTTGYGDRNWIPLVGDWDGNGSDTVGFFDPSTCVWYLRNSLSTGYADYTFACGDPSLVWGHGANNWAPITGDWDGLQGDAIGFFDPQNSVFMLRNSLTTGAADLTFGFGAAGAGWHPLVGTWQTAKSAAAVAPAEAKAVDSLDLAEVVALELSRRAIDEALADEMLGQRPNG